MWFCVLSAVCCFMFVCMDFLALECVLACLLVCRVCDVFAGGCMLPPSVFFCFFCAFFCLWIVFVAVVLAVLFMSVLIVCVVGCMIALVCCLKVFGFACLCVRGL